MTRWWILFLFSVLAIVQAASWNFYGPISDSVIDVFGCVRTRRSFVSPFLLAVNDSVGLGGFFSTILQGLTLFFFLGSFCRGLTEL